MMRPRIAVHHRPGSFSERWISYCRDHGVDCRVVDCLRGDVIEQVRGADGLLWNWRHDHPEELQIARQILTAVERMGLLAFPDSLTSWHYDDKVAQKYLLEAIGAPLVPTYVFVNKGEALDWINTATFPKVFKLRSGAGSANVSLINTAGEAAKASEEMFSARGGAAVKGYFSDLRRKIGSIGSFEDLLAKLTRMTASVHTIRQQRNLLPTQRGYLYFQDFLPGNTYDTRVVIIGDRAFGFLRMNRPGDFRASGSGNIVYDPSLVDSRCVQVAFAVAGSLGSKSLAFDFLMDEGSNPRIVEISYTYASGAFHECPGYWDVCLNWHEGHLWAEDLIIEDFLAVLASRQLSTSQCV